VSSRPASPLTTCPQSPPHLTSLAPSPLPSPPTATPFLERDPSLSQLGADVDTVPNTQLIYISFVLPVLSLVFFTALESRLTRGRIVTADVAWTVLWRFVALCQALGVALAATNTIKNTAARQRPSFFDLTNYAGYHAAVHTNTPSAYAAYDAGTVAGQLGSLSKALSTAKLDDAQRSFPSGHASLSFSGMAFLVGLARTILRVRPGVWFSPRAFVACAPLVLAAFIAISRVRDRKHNPDDVSVGTALGILGGVLAWQQYAAEARARDALVAEAEEVEGLAKGARRGGADGSASAEV
jgi:membrane-associated phospholipid phosphatase